MIFERFRDARVLILAIVCRFEAGSLCSGVCVVRSDSSLGKTLGMGKRASKLGLSNKPFQRFHFSHRHRGDLETLTAALMKGQD